MTKVHVGVKLTFAAISEFYEPARCCLSPQTLHDSAAVSGISRARESIWKKKEIFAGVVLRDFFASSKKLP